MNEQTEPTLQDQLLKILFSEDLGEELSNIAQLLMNAAMLIEHENHIGVAPYQRVVQCNGHAKGFKPPSFQTAIATLKAIGIRRDDGKRMMLGVSCSLSEAEVHWCEFLVSLEESEIGMPVPILSDAHTELKAPECAAAMPANGSAAPITTA